MGRIPLRSVWLVALLSSCADLWAQSAPALDARTPPVYRVGVLTDNYPFSFEDSDGRIKGFAHEIVEEIERSMALRLTRVPGKTTDINSAFVEGRLDLLQSYVQFPERGGHADFSVPYLNMTGALFARKGGPVIRQLSDLKGKRVLVHRGSLGEAVLQRAGLEDSIVYSRSVEESLQSLNRGEGDAVLVSRLNGLVLKHRLGLDHVEPLSVRVEGYDVRYCIAVRPGHADLLAKVNEGLAVLVRTGRFDEIYTKWFGHVEVRRYSGEQIMAAIAVGLAVALAVALWAAAKQATMRRQIVQQAEALRVSEERHRGIFEGARDGLLVLSQGPAGLEAEQVNPAALRLLGRDALPPGRVGLEALFAPDPALAQGVRAAAGRSRAEEFEHERPAGTAWLRVVVSPLGSKWLVSLADITESVKARIKLQRQEEQLRQKQKLEAIGTLAGGVAHDFNNLLTAILGNTELALMNLPPDHTEVSGLRLVLKAGKRARDLVQQILTFSRQTRAKREVVKLGPMVEETIHLLKTLARGTVEFVVQVPPALPAVNADPAQVHQVLMNVGTNAVQAMRGTPGKLLFQAEVVMAGPELQAQHAELKPGCYVRLALQDTGPGMADEVRRRLFEPFFTTKGPGEGTGLGLSVVHGIMQQHGGAVTVYSQLGRGTLFHLYFPAAEEVASAPLADEPLPAAPGKGETVMFVDDDLANVETARKLIEQLGFRVSAHLNPNEAWSEYQRRPGEFALVISDFTMPGMNGLQLLLSIRGLRPAQPVILCSGFFSEAERAEAVALGIHLFLPKPLSYAGLFRASVEALARR